jgi:1-acyl-sn-glycerol-3-phosphate acyltransferase
MTVYPARYAHFMAKEELFRTPGFGWLMRQYGAIPLDRHRGDVGAIRHALTILEQGGCVVLFPEGTRSKTGQPGRPRPGIGLLACLAQAPVIPVRVSHTERWISREPLSIRFGKPVHFSGGENRQDYENFAKRIMEEIFKL